LKPGEPDYAGIDKDISKEGGTEKKSDIEGIMKTTPGYGGEYDIHNIELKESKEKVPVSRDGEVPKETDNTYVDSIALERKLAIPPNPSGREGQYKDFSGLNLNLNQEISGFGEDTSDFIGFGGTNGDDIPDYEDIDKVAQEKDEENEGEGEEGSEGREHSYEV